MNAHYNRIVLGLYTTIALAAALFLLAAATASAAESFDESLLQIQHRWAEANYRVEGGAQKRAFESLLEEARGLAATWPDRAEALAWQGIVASSYAGIKGPFGAMSLAKEARASLEAAERLDPTVLDGSVYTSLGVLYYKVPGGLIGFGDDAVARRYLEKAIAANPDGIDPNYFWGEFLYEQGDYEAARRALLRAEKAPPRRDRPLADVGRRQEVAALLNKVNRRLANAS